MPISNDTELVDVIRRIGQDMQDVQDYLNSGKGSAAPKYELKFSFPSGYMHKTREHRVKYWFIRDDTLRANLSYNLVFYDLLRWVNDRVQLFRPPDSMVFKHMIIVIGAVCEVLAIEVVGKGMFAKLITKLKAQDIIDANLETELHWLRDARNLIHYDKQDKYELDRYKPSDLQKAVKVLDRLCHALGTYCEGEARYDSLKKIRDKQGTHLAKTVL